MAITYTILGLGNPGQEYVGSRHNAGRMVAEVFAKKEQLNDFVMDKKTNSLLTKGKVGKSQVVVALPETFMNKSGVTAGVLVKNKKQAETLVVIHDDLALPLGVCRISFNKSSGGHRGVESIMKVLKTEAFVRIRMGVCPTTAGGKLKRPEGDDITDFIIGQFKKPEMDVFKKVVKKAADAVVCLVTEGRSKAMTEFNS